MTEIKERISKLIGDGPDTDPAVGYIARDVHDVWYRWRGALIDRLASQAKTVYFSQEQGYLSEEQENCDTHSALILDIQPIRKGVTKAELIEVLDDALCLARVDDREGKFYANIKRVLDKLNIEGIIND